MAQNRTAESFRKRFKETNKRGVVSQDINIKQRSKDDPKIKEEGNLRSQLQFKIRDLIKEGKSIDEVKDSINKEEYAKYQQYIDKWIESWIMKLNPNMKKRIMQLLKERKNEEEILVDINTEYEEIYVKYETTIRGFIESEIRLMEQKNKEEDER